MLFWGAVFVWLNFEVWILTRNIQVWILYNRLDSIILGLIKIYDGIFGKGCIFKDIGNNLAYLHGGKKINIEYFWSFFPM